MKHTLGWLLAHPLLFGKPMDETYGLLLTKCFPPSLPDMLRHVIKINVDAAFQYETLSGATVAVARDGRGNFIPAATWFLQQSSVLIRQRSQQGMSYT